jgi:aminoglycoside phosphotransferase (APT) family kinase protein
MASHPDVDSPSSSSGSDLSDGDEPFSPILQRIDPKRFSDFALSMRQANSSGNDTAIITCQTQLTPLHGSYNLAYKLEFSDGVSWIMRIPVSNKDGEYDGPQTRSIESEVTTLQYIRKHTTIPIPEIFAWGPTDDDVGVPYILMDFAPGIPVWKLWFKKNGKTPLADRRLRILESLATSLSQLSAFSFHNIGSLLVSRPQCATVPVHTVNEQVVVDAMIAGKEEDHGFTRIGPFSSSQNYLTALLRMHTIPHSEDERKDYEISLGAHRLLSMIIDCLPPWIESHDNGRESFVLSPPDFNYQNILAKEDGTITAFIDWDNVHTVPRYIGYARYPLWITRDWDPNMYGFGLPGCPLEESPQPLQAYRQHYAKAMHAARPARQIDYTTKSHLYEAIWIAASSPRSKLEILEKVFEHVFPPEEQEGEEYPLDHVDTIYDIANETLSAGAKERIIQTFRHVLTPGS